MIFRRVFFLSLLSLLLTSCVKLDSLYDLAGPSGFPTVTVSSTNVAQGNFVEVTVKTLVYLDPRSSLEANKTDFDFGICFALEGKQNCTPGTRFILPQNVFLKGEESNFVYVNQVVKRGEYISIEHTFNFSSTAPGTVTLVGVGEGPYTNLSQLPKDYVSVTFN
jgi:hypothetical protein